ncbi:hypothetical protein CDAR_209181 [Caerostris darwini]|uniref:Ribosomal protein S12 n=1 Tax=Caerostris darwini TaxID=1538125 RepID=A0AAV4VFH4_9ARAC|nr:hypothetical protein CDAR_209181 [Caerostris darwini]
MNEKTKQNTKAVDPFLRKSTSKSPPELRKAQRPSPPSLLARVSIRHERSRPNLSGPKNKEISRLQANLISGIPLGRIFISISPPCRAEGRKKGVPRP